MRQLYCLCRRYCTRRIQFLSPANVSPLLPTSFSQAATIVTSTDRTTEEFLKIIGSSTSDHSPTIESVDVTSVDEDALEVFDGDSKLDNFRITEIVEKMMEYLQNSLGLTTSTSIIICTSLLQLCLVRFHYDVEKWFTISNKYYKENKLLTLALIDAKRAHDNKAIKAADRDLEMFGRAVGYPAWIRKWLVRGLILILPLCHLTAIHKLCSFENGVANLGSFAWINNIAVPDVTFMLPAITSFLFFVYIQKFIRPYHALNNLKNYTALFGVATVGILLSIWLYSYCKSQPAAVNLCLASHLAYTVVFSLVLRTVPIRKFLNLSPIVTRPLISEKKYRPNLNNQRLNDLNAKQLSSVERMRKALKFLRSILKSSDKARKEYAQEMLNKNLALKRELVKRRMSKN